MLITLGSFDERDDLDGFSLDGLRQRSDSWWKGKGRGEGPFFPFSKAHIIEHTHIYIHVDNWKGKVNECVVRCLFPNGPS